MGGYVQRATVGVALAVVMALAGAGAAQAAWSGADPLATGRYDHTATLLDGGRVLVTGGHGNGPVGSAQLYDAATNGWSSAAPMDLARHGHAAVRLHSGKVLVAGGFAPTADPASPAGGYTRTAELYDPGANTWTKAANMSTGRFQPTMTVLHDGRVLVAGGSGDIETARGILAAVPLATAEVYDPAKNSWTDVPSMSVPRSLHTATLLRSGDVLVAGGFDDATGELRSAELYDPSSNRWSATGPLAEARDSATATALPNGEVLVAGGDGGARSALASAEVYQPGSGTWRAAASMAGARQTAAAALLEDGMVLVAGGEDARFGNPLDTAERYDPAADSWTDAGAMAVARRQHSLTALSDGRALVVGGNAGGFAGGVAGAERFSTVTTSLTAAGSASRLVDTSGAVMHSVLTNTGSAPLLVTGLSVTGADARDFAIVSESCRASPVPPGGTCEVGLQFTPTAAGARSATLTVADNTAAGTTTAALTGSGERPAPVPEGTNPDAGAPAGRSGGTDATAGAGPATGPGQTAGAGPATGPGQTAGAGETIAAGAGPGPHGARGPVARASCTVRTTRRRHGHSGSTVACRMTWPASGAIALRARLMHASRTLVRARATARAGQATLTLRPAGRLRPDRYAVVIARPDGTVVIRTEIRVP
ncbi:MAG: hypothetical protein QOF04_1819 [Solirubrobacteraceae bacterium]|nr:hypothetical protein [Solirubrobacteraceae bacterium]